MNEDEAIEVVEVKLPPIFKAAAKPSKAHLAKAIPTDRVSSDKQASVLRAYAAASGPEKKAVSNEEVAAVVSGLVASSISLCNPFFVDSGLLIPEGRKQRPVDAVFDYLHAYEWNPETAMQKLKAVMQETWAAKTLLPKLAFRTLSKDEAIQFLADESKATKAHRKNLETLLEFLSNSGVLKVDNNAVSKVPGQATPPMGTVHPLHPQNPAAETPKAAVVEEPKLSKDVEQFTIPIPGKEAAVITVPKNLDADDWDMLSLMIATYIKRLRRDSDKGNSS